MSDHKLSRVVLGIVRSNAAQAKRAEAKARMEGNFRDGSHTPFVVVPRMSVIDPGVKRP